MFLASQSSLLIVEHLAEDQQTKLIKLMDRAVLISLQNTSGLHAVRSGPLGSFCKQKRLSGNVDFAAFKKSWAKSTGSVAQVVRAHA